MIFPRKGKRKGEEGLICLVSSSFSYVKIYFLVIWTSESFQRFETHILNIFNAYLLSIKKEYIYMN